jgi:hypothetical protein
MFIQCLVNGMTSKKIVMTRLSEISAESQFFSELLMSNVLTGIDLFYCKFYLLFCFFIEFLNVLNESLQDIIISIPFK